MSDTPTAPEGAPFKLWRTTPGKPEQVFARGTVADDGAITVTWLALGRLPEPGELQLDALLEHLGTSGPGVSFRVELVDPGGDG